MVKLILLTAVIATLLAEATSLQGGGKTEIVDKELFRIHPLHDLFC